MITTAALRTVAGLSALGLLVLTACGGAAHLGGPPVRGSAPEECVVAASPPVTGNARAAALAEPTPISEWLATDGRIAHRGGSRDWPEMSRLAYDGALAAGYRALEISLARTSDGVWFGLHDRSLDRTSGTDDLIAATSTWKQVQKLRITADESDLGNPTHQPYLTLEEFLDRYYGKAVLFIDVKKASGHTDELLDVLDSLPGDPTRSIVAKHVWRTSKPWLAEARERGYTTWRAFRPSHDFTRHHEDADILGMSYRASTCAWNEIRALGKPVIAHVVPHARGAAVALDKGADGLMVSGVSDVARP